MLAATGGDDADDVGVALAGVGVGVFAAVVVVAVMRPPSSAPRRSTPSGVLFVGRASVGRWSCTGNSGSIFFGRCTSTGNSGT